MKRVVIESPYAASDEVALGMNVSYAQQAMLDSLTRGEAPFASHLLYTQVLDDQLPEDRRRGIEAGLRLCEGFELTAVYADWGLTEGMRIGIRRAGRACRPYEIRYVYGPDVGRGAEGEGGRDGVASECLRLWHEGKSEAEPEDGRLVGIPHAIVQELRRAWQTMQDAIDNAPGDSLGKAMTAAALEHRALMKVGAILKKEFWG